jgi:hypothetical protein
VNGDFKLRDSYRTLQVIERVEIDDVLRHVGVGMWIREIVKMKLNNEKIQKVSEIITRLAESGLKVK